MSLKLPLVDDILIIFKRSHEFSALQSVNTLVTAEIIRADLWQPILDSIVGCIHDCVAEEKTALASKQKLLTKRLEEVLVSFVESEYSSFKSDDQNHLPGHMKGLIRLHATDFIRIMKREMCHNMTVGEEAVRSIIKHVFVTWLDDLRKEKVMRDSSRESL